jgi:hypothetical protein
MSVLPDVLEDIVGSYVDRPTYQTLIEYDPLVHTRKKLCETDLKDIPERDIYLFSEAYKLSKEYVKTYHSSLYINPMDYIGIFIELLQFYGVSNLSILLEKQYTKEFKGEETILSYVQDRISNETTNKSDLIITAANNFWKDLSKKQKKLFDEVLPSSEFLESQIIARISVAIENLTETENNFYPMTNSIEYINEILKIVKQNLEEESEEENDEEENKEDYYGEEN